MAERNEGSAQLDSSHWRGSPYDRLLKKASRMTPRSGEICSRCSTRLPLPTGVPDFREWVTTALPALFGVWRSVGFKTVTAPVVGFLRCPAIAFSPLRVAPDRLYRLP